jgi:hypothetical protein
MSPSSSYPRSVCSILLVGVVAGFARGADVQNLLQTSPFAPVVGANAPGPAAASLEFRGVFADQGEYFFSLFETATRRGAWVGLNEPGNPFTVRAYDRANETVTAEYQGRTLQLTLKTAKILVSAAPPVPATNAPGPVLVQPAAPVGTPEAQIVEEIRRRRALRQQSAAASVTPASPAPVVPPPPKQQP